MINPNKHIRAAIVSAMSPVPVHYKRTPKTRDNGSEYVVMDSQSKQRTSISKSGYEWMCQVNIDAYSITEIGMPPTTNIDDLEENILNAMSDLNVGGGFTTKFVRLLNQIDLDVQTDTENIERRVLTYELWISKI